ncbi:hypothetical protein NEUTE2DRAFT_126305 [Neurospora tetrasperma FGSC 2509]|nr:hypothetical protein NEUTE2DRAFT_126305 [Neurospora tetrasperma FGSC 2509]
MLPLIVSERGPMNCVCFLKDVVATKILKPLGWDKRDCTNSARRYANHKAPRRAYTPSIPSYSPGTSCMRGPFSALHGPGMQQATVTVERGRTQVRSRETHKFTRWGPSWLESSTGLGPAQNMPERHHMRSTTSAGYIDRARSLHCELPE